MPIDIYLSDVTSAVEIITAPSGNLMAKGLPVLQVGTWNGKPYTADDLKALAANFADIQASDQWEPPLRPYHAYDREGKPLSHSAAETLGWHKALRYDEETERLLADVELVNRETAADMISGKLRYVSSEVGRDAYTSPVTQKEYPLAYMGGAFVDNPAVKGMPWQIVLNAAEFGHGPDSGKVDTFAMWAGYSADAVRSMVNAKAFPPAATGGPTSSWVRDLYEDYVIAEVDGETYRIPFSFDPDGNLQIGEKKEVKQTWVEAAAADLAVETFADTTEAAGMKKSILPAACFLIPATRALPYRDADPASDLDEEGRHTKAGPVNCGRVRAVAAALKGARGSQLSPDDLSPAAVRKLKAAAKACQVASPVIDELFADTPAGDPGNTAGTPGVKGAKSMGLIEVLKAKFKARGVPDEELTELDQLSETPPVSPPADPPPVTPPAPPVAEPDPAITQQLEQLSKANVELKGQVETMAADTRRTKAAATVDEWVHGGKLPPALRVPTFALLDGLMAAPPAEIDVLEVQKDAEGKETQAIRKASALDLLGEIVMGIAPVIHTGAPKGHTLTLATDDPEGPKQMTDEELDKFAGTAKAAK